VVEIESNVLLYDLETRNSGFANPEKDTLRIFGCYSYKTKRYYLLTDKEQIIKTINAHKFLVGFNTEEYDEKILKREGIDVQYKIRIDLYDLIKKRAGGMKIKEGMLKDVLMSYSLDYITQTLGLADKETAKLEFDYNLFNKDSWTQDEMKLIREYCERDLELTKKLYEWTEEYFESFKSFLHVEDVTKKRYLTVSIAKFAYKSICKALNWTEEYPQHGTQSDVETEITGGYVAYPAGEEYHNNCYCLDFACLTEDTKIKMWRDSKQYYNKKISKLKIRDFVVNQDGKQQIDNIRIQDYEGEVIEIELNNGKKITCTSQHIFPVIRDKIMIEVRAEEILETDELITTYTKRLDKNPNWSNRNIKKECYVCGKEFYTFVSQNFKTCGDKQCVNKLQSINSKKTNLGKNKDNCEHMKKMSLERKGKQRPVLIRKNIAEGNRIATQNNFANGKFLYKGIYFKSIYEMKVAQALDRDKIKWVYEPEVFQLDNIDVYTPDFYLPDLDKYLEVKGHLILDTKSSGYRKFKKFIKQHPNSVLINEENKKEVLGILNGKN
jgi:hypothetical protein